MRALYKNTLLTFLLFIPLVCLANPWQVTVGFGHNRLDIKPQYQDIDPSEYPKSRSRGVSNLGVYPRASYTFDFGLQLGAGVRHSESIDIFGAFDTFALTEAIADIGYQWKITRRFHITPKIGISRWHLKADEGAFLNPGKEKRKDFYGNEYFMPSISLEFPFRGGSLIYMSYGKTEFEFADAEHITFGFGRHF